MDELRASLAAGDEARSELPIDHELRALGTIVTLEGGDATHPLKLDSLERLRAGKASSQQPWWLLLSVVPADSTAGTTERATVWVGDDHRAKFVKLFEDYLHRDTRTGKPSNNQLVANIGRIQGAVLRDLWQSDGEPPRGGKVWWEVWLRPATNGPEQLQQFAVARRLRVSARVLQLVDRQVMWVEARWADLEVLLFTAVPVAEVRRPQFVDSIEDLTLDEQAEYVDDLAQRLKPADDVAPAVCHLDTGVLRTHALLVGSLAAQDLHTVIGDSGADRDGHGTRMAGVALLGDLDHHLSASHEVHLRHRLESVRILPVRGEPRTEPIAYGDVTAQAVALPEIVANRRRVFCMPVTDHGDVPAHPGQPTLWSTTVDALCAGASVVREGNNLRLLAPPDLSATRLVIVSAGNTRTSVADHLAESDTSPVEDPGQAWNVLTVGAHTELVTLPTDPAYAGWEVVAPAGELSPHSRTSLPFGRAPWPIKPDIVLEGGNVLHDGDSSFQTDHPVLCLRTTGHSSDLALASANATSVATAQAARLAALTMATYPEYWAETIRALLVHAAEWTPAMRAQLDAARAEGQKARQQMILRRYGWGVPSEERVLHSTGQSVRLVIQDEFIPFVGQEFTTPNFRLHDLPWPREVLEDLGSTAVTLRVTLSYFVEPTASRRGWRQRYAYPSHSLRFELQDPLESESEFVKRVNRDRGTEEAGGRPSSSQIDWLVGPQQRNLGSLHADIWETTGATLARSSRLAVYPVGGWWKNNKNRARADRPVRYSLILSLSTPREDVDLYTPIATLLRVPTTIAVQ